MKINLSMKYLIVLTFCFYSSQNKLLSFVWFDSFFYVPVNSFYLCWDGSSWVEQALTWINVSCSSTKHSDTGEAQTRNPLISSQALYHYTPSQDK